MDRIDHNSEVIVTDRFVAGPEDHLTAEEVAALTPQIVIQRVKALAPFIAQHAHITEERGRPTDEVWRAIRRTGYLYLFRPKRFGGLQATMDEIYDASYPIAAADASAGWLCAFSVFNPRSIAGFPMRAQEELYAGNKCFTLLIVPSPFGEARKVEGGWLVSGRWAWATTCQVADWVSMMARAEDGKIMSFLTPASNVTIVKTWRAHGMIGTGTHHVVADEVFVPDHMAARSSVFEPEWHQEARRHYDWPLFFGPPGVALGLSVSMTVVGAAYGAVEAAKQRLLRYNKKLSTIPEREKASAQSRLAQAFCLVTAADQLMRHATQQIYTMVGNDNAEDESLFHEAKAWLAEVGELCRNAVQLPMLSAGTTVHYFDSPVGRAYRDVMTASSHGTCDFDAGMEGWGRKMLGLDSERRATMDKRVQVRDEIEHTKNVHGYAKA